MSKYHHYARDLNDAFIEARTAYKEAFDKFRKAETELRDCESACKGYMAVPYDKENARLKAKLKYNDEKQAMMECDAWDKFNAHREELKAALDKELQADSLVNPDKLDHNAVYLLDSGAMNAEDYLSFAEKYKGNNTMLRLIGTAVEKALSGDVKIEERAALLKAKEACKTEEGRILDLWNALDYAATTFSGQQRGDNISRPELCVDLSRNWEKIADEVLEQF